MVEIAPQNRLDQFRTTPAPALCSVTSAAFSFRAGKSVGHSDGQGQIADLEEGMVVLGVSRPDYSEPARHRTPFSAASNPPVLLMTP